MKKSFKILDLDGFLRCEILATRYSYSDIFIYKYIKLQILIF
jgi:hypothetical protein